MVGDGSGEGLILQAANTRVLGMQIYKFEVGISIEPGATSSLIGSDADGTRDDEECNAFWNNPIAHILIEGQDVDGHRVSGNNIGVDADGQAPALPDESYGIWITGNASNNLIGPTMIGGAAAGRGNRIQNNEIGVLIDGTSSADNEINGNIIGAGSTGDRQAAANRIGVLIYDASGTKIGGNRIDPSVDPIMSNSIASNMRDGIQIHDDATDTVVRGNFISDNRRDGVRLARTRTGGNTLRENSITGNGGEAIAVIPLSPELPPPTILWVDRVGGQLGGSACANCLVEVFADPADEAAHLMGRATALPNGDWSLGGLDLVASQDFSLTATATLPGGSVGAFSTSRLSDGFPLGPLWHLVEIPGRSPRALMSGQRVFERFYRLYNEDRRPVPNAEVRFAPLDLIFTTDAKGVLRCAIGLDDALRFGSRTMSFTVEAVDESGRAHPVRWHPHVVVGFGRPAPDIGDTILDLSGLGPNGIGGLLTRSTPAVQVGALREALIPAWLRGNSVENHR